MATDEGAAVMDEIYGWTDVMNNSEFDVINKQLKNSDFTTIKVLTGLIFSRLKFLL